MDYPTVAISRKRVAEVQRLLARDSLKAKASVSISSGVLRAADLLARESGRSAFMERALRSYIRARLRAARRATDTALINARANVTSREADDLMSIQSWPE